MGTSGLQPVSQKHWCGSGLGSWHRMWRAVPWDGAVNLWNLTLSLVESVRMELDCRPPSWCPRTALWCGDTSPRPHRWNLGQNL